MICEINLKPPTQAPDASFLGGVMRGAARCWGRDCPRVCCFPMGGREMSSTGIAYSARLTLQLLCVRYSDEDVASPKTEKFWASIMVDNH